MQKGYFAVFCFYFFVCLKNGLPPPTPQSLRKILVSPLGNLVRNGYPPPLSRNSEVPKLALLVSEDQKKLWNFVRMEDATSTPTHLTFKLPNQQKKNQEFNYLFHFSAKMFRSQIKAIFCAKRDRENSSSCPGNTNQTAMDQQGSHIFTT